MAGQNYILPKNYKKIGWGFLTLAILTSTFIFYLIWAKVTIIIIPNTEEIAQDFLFDIREGAAISPFNQDQAVAGRIESIEVEGSQTFSASGLKLVESEIVGEVTVFNNYSKEQALVKTTRLAAFDKSDKTLVRLNKDITVLPGQQVKVQVYPDDPVNFTDLEPMKFVIPGLWGPLQEKIYAQSSEKLTKGGHQISVIAEADLTQAEEKLKTALYQQASAEVSQRLDPKETLWPKLVSAKVEEISYDVKVGDEASEFTAKMKLKAVVVVFDESQLISLAREKIKANLPAGKQLVDLDPKSFSYFVEKYNLETKEANVRVSLKGSSVLANNAELFDKSKLLGLTEEEIKSYFSQFSEVKSVEVKFSPSWLKKTPRFQEKIEIKISGD